MPLRNLRRLNRKLLALLLALTLSAPGAAFGAHENASCTTGTPSASPPSAATPVAPVDLDTAYLALQLNLAHQSAFIADLALVDLAHDDVQQYALDAQATAEEDTETIAALGVASAPGDSTTLFALAAAIDAVKMELDLPAGEAGTSVESDAAGLTALCAGEGPFDTFYVAAAHDLAQRQVDLAKVAAVAANDLAVREFAVAVIERETADIGALIVIQADSLDATPVS